MSAFGSVADLIAPARDRLALAEKRGDAADRRLALRSLVRALAGRRVPNSMDGLRQIAALDVRMRAEEMDEETLRRLVCELEEDC